MLNKTNALIDAMEEKFSHIELLDSLVYSNSEILSEEAVDQIENDIYYLFNDLEELILDYQSEYVWIDYQVDVQSLDANEFITVAFYSKYFNESAHFLFHKEAFITAMSGLDYDIEYNENEALYKIYLF
jgi:hypothetical protein